MEQKSLVLEINIVSVDVGMSQRVGGLNLREEWWVATCRIGGMVFRGDKENSPVVAVQALCARLISPHQTDEADSQIAIALALEGKTVSSLFLPVDAPPALDKASIVETTAHVATDETQGSTGSYPT